MATDIRIMRVEPTDDKDIMLWLLAMQIDGNDCWDSILQGLNEKGQNDMIDFIDSILYEQDELPCSTG